MNDELRRQVLELYRDADRAVEAAGPVCVASGRCCRVKEYGPTSRQVKDCSDGFHFEPHVAELVFKDMVREAGVTVVFGQRLERVRKAGAHLEEVGCAGGGPGIVGVSERRPRWARG